MNPNEPSRVRAAVVRFAPGARNAWHAHAVGLTIHVTESNGANDGPVPSTDHRWTGSDDDLCRRPCVVPWPALGRSPRPTPVAVDGPQAGVASIRNTGWSAGSGSSSMDRRQSQVIVAA